MSSMKLPEASDPKEFLSFCFWASNGPQELQLLDRLEQNFGCHGMNFDEEEE